MKYIFEDVVINEILEYLSERPWKEVNQYMVSLKTKGMPMTEKMEKAVMENVPKKSRGKNE
jgi:hypothetical protein